MLKHVSGGKSSINFLWQGSVHSQSRSVSKHNADSVSELQYID